MLVLSRHVGEAIRLGENIEVRILDVSGDVVRLGIDAPRSVQVLREEVYQSIVSETMAALRAPVLQGVSIGPPAESPE